MFSGRVAFGARFLPFRFILNFLNLDSESTAVWFIVLFMVDSLGKKSGRSGCVDWLGGWLLVPALSWTASGPKSTSKRSSGWFMVAWKLDWMAFLPPVGSCWSSVSR